MINFRKVLQLLIVLALEMRLSLGATCAPYRQQTSQWIQTGVITPIINGTYSNKAWNYTVTYQSSNPTSVISYAHYVQDKYMNYMRVTVQVTGGFILQYLELNYLKNEVGGYEYTFFRSLLFWDEKNYSAQADPNIEANFTFPINITKGGEVTGYLKTSLPEQTNKLLIFMTFLNLTSTQGNLNKLTISYGYRNQTYLNMYMYKPLGVKINLYAVSAIYYSTNSFTTPSKDLRWGGTFNFSSAGGTQMTGNTWSASTMFVGLAFIQVYNESSVIDYQSSFIMSLKSNLTVLPQKPYNTLNLGLKSTTTSYFQIFRVLCNISAYIYNVVDKLCYDVCPAGTKNYTAYLPRCYGCSYKCGDCSNSSWDPFMGTVSTCSSCNATNLRTLVNGQCACVNSSYFDDGYSAKCRACSTIVVGTLTCEFTLNSSQATWYYSGLFAGNWTINVLPLYKSLTCGAGYVVYNNLCATCAQAIPYCTSCTNATQCTTCNASKPATKYTDGKCYICNVTNCAVCKQDNVCSSCALGYIVNGSSCIVQPCNTSCTCGGYSLPMVNGSCSTTCGDGIKVGTQQCDDGNIADLDGCNSLCKIQTCGQNCSCSGWYFPYVNNSCTTQCGDGFKVGTEQCDDHNTVSHDGCSSTCMIQTCSQSCSCGGYTLPVINDTCSTLCGDGVKAGVEECDDGNAVNGDGCSSNCITQDCSALCTCDGWAFPRINGTCSATCGDGLLRGTQECDDHNLINFDGCSSTCQTQGCNKTCNCSGWDFPRVNGLCTTTCGDFIIAGTQECDDGNAIDYDGCSSACKIQPCNVTCDCQGWYLPRTGSLCASICGDGQITTTEQCDDGNTQSHDGCSSECIIETSCNQTCSCNGFTLPFLNGSCSGICGDGLLRGGEQCDDANTVSHDGCDSICKIQTLCIQSCSCNGWTRPFVNGSCSTVCGDSLIRGNEECDDGNAISHDGCSSTCKIETACNQSCSCNGWTRPFVNGLCSTICGDGIVLGLQECDDGNTVLGDGCSDQCTFEISMVMTKGAKQFLFFSQQKTYYPSLVMFGMGFRIIGMEMLWIYQSFQLLLQTQPSSPIKISNNIHGYSDSQGFPFKIPHVENQLFDNFNYMFFFILFVFIVCTFLETLGECCRSGNQIANMTEESPLSFSKGPNGLSQKQYQFEEDRDDGNEQFTVHYDKKSLYRHDLLSQTQAMSVQLSELQAPPQPPTFFSRLSKIILRQFFFDLILNVQPVIMTSLVTQILSNGLQSVMNFPTLITFGVIELFFVGILLFCWRGGQFFGENQAKFKDNKFMNYWLVTSVQKVLISIVIGGKFTYYVYVIVGIKLCVMLYFWLDKVYHSKAQNYRCIIMQFLHFALFTIFTVNKVYLTPTGIITTLPQNLLETVYTVILGMVFVITLAFYMKEFLNKCSADNRQIMDQGDDPIPQRTFYSRREVQDYGTKTKSNIKPTSSSIIQEIKSKKVVKNETMNSQRSRNTQRSRQQQQEQSEYYEEAPKNSRMTHESRNRQQQFRGNEDSRMSNFRETQDKLENSRYAKSTKGRSFMKSTRRVGRQKDVNKQNTPYKSRFEQQSQPEQQNYNYGNKSSYRGDYQNESKISKVKRTRTHNDVKSHRNATQEDESSNDYQNNYDAVSIRFR